MKPTLVLQAYGCAPLRHQARFAVQSWLHWLEPSAFRVLLFTDAPDEFAAALPADLDWATEPMDARRLADWRGGIDFVHRVKIEALRCAAARCGGPLLYLDGDTACVAHPQPLLDALAAGHPVMHTFEGRLAASPHRLHRKIWRKLRSFGEFQVDLSQGERVLTADTPMWNAGVIGLAPAHLRLLDDALVLTDMLYSMYPKHVMEQLAFSFLLDGEGPIEAADGVILHYWQDKAAWDDRLASLYATYPHDPPPRHVVADLLAHPPRQRPAPRRWWWLFYP